MPTIRAWQFTVPVSSGLENSMHLSTSVPVPSISDTQLLIEVHSTAFNPADYKIVEVLLLSRAELPSQCILGMKFAGEVAAIGSKLAGFSLGEWVFGTLCEIQRRGNLAMFIVVEHNMLVKMPHHMELVQFAGVGAVGLTAYQAIVLHVEKGSRDRVFVNGGSGGMGVFSIQIAKALGCYVTATCSTTNVGFCKCLVADEVLNYKEVEVDNVGSSADSYYPAARSLYRLAQE